MKTNKVNIYYDAQEYYDQLTLESKIQAQAQTENVEAPTAVSSHSESTLALIEALFPDADARTVLESVVTKIDTFTAIGRQYKVDIEQGGSRYKDVLLIAMAEIVIELQPYDILLKSLYPHMNPFFNNLQRWYRDYLNGVDQNDSILGRA